ncbi:NmrA family NAD(P)-binding protein, partial [candidate division KSB1 bacterium]|nr:NmrA family NAD(P)-binding protein [candidate division KSB1 bacterium]
NFLAKALEGATAVYAMIPPNFKTNDYRGYQNQIAENIAVAIEKSGVKYIVTLSSVGAHLPEKAGVVQGLGDFEQRLNQINGLNVLHLRPTYFMENTLGQVGMIKMMGFMGSPVKADLKFPIVATKDIAEVAAKKMLSLDFKGTGNVHYILGSRDVTYNEIAQVFGKAIGKPDLKYMEATYQDAKFGMMQGWGVTENVADAMNEFAKSMNEGKVLSDTKRTPANTTPTSLEEFAHVFAHVYQNS